MQVQGKPEQVDLTSEPDSELSSSYLPSSPEQIITVVSQIPDARPIFSRHNVDDKVIFPTRKPGEQHPSTFFESIYSIFNTAYAAWTTGTDDEESKSPQPEVSSPRFSSSSYYSGINPPPNANSEPIGTRELRDRYEAWPFIGTASQYDIDNYYASEDQDESFEVA